MANSRAEINPLRQSDEESWVSDEVSWKGWLFTAEKAIDTAKAEKPGNDVGLGDFAAAVVASELPYEIVEKYEFKIPEELQFKIASYSFPLTEYSILLYSCLSNGDDETYLRGMQYYKSNKVSDVIQIGFCLTGTVMGARNLQHEVVITFDRNRITDCKCTCTSQVAWCSHVAALSLYRIYSFKDVQIRPSFRESFNRCTKTELQKFCQCLINQLPHEYFHVAQSFLDDLLSPKSNELKMSCGAPDPTAGAVVDEISTWYLDKSHLRGLIQKAMSKFCIIPPMVYSDVTSLNHSIPLVVNEYLTLLRPLRATEPEAVCNIFGIIRLLLSKNDRNALDILFMVTEELISSQQLMEWWFGVDVAIYGEIHPYHIKYSGVNNSYVTQKSASIACNRMVQLWRYAVLNPLMSTEEKSYFKNLFKNWQMKIFTMLWENSTLLKVGGSLKYYPHIMDFHNFSGFKPAIEACNINWEDFDIPSIERSSKRFDIGTYWKYDSFPFAANLKRIELEYINGSNETSVNLMKVGVVHSRRIHTIINRLNIREIQGKCDAERNPILKFLHDQFSASRCVVNKYVNSTFPMSNAFTMQVMMKKCRLSDVLNFNVAPDGSVIDVPSATGSEQDKKDGSDDVNGVKQVNGASSKSKSRKARKKLKQKRASIFNNSDTASIGTTNTKKSAVIINENPDAINDDIASSDSANKDQFEEDVNEKNDVTLTNDCNARENENTKISYLQETAADNVTQRKENVSQPLSRLPTEYSSSNDVENATVADRGMVPNGTRQTPISALLSPVPPVNTVDFNGVGGEVAVDDSINYIASSSKSAIKEYIQLVNKKKNGSTNCVEQNTTNANQQKPQQQKQEQEQQQRVDENEHCVLHTAASSDSDSETDDIDSRNDDLINHEVGGTIEIIDNVDIGDPAEFLRQINDDTNIEPEEYLESGFFYNTGKLDNNWDMSFAQFQGLTVFNQRSKATEIAAKLAKAILMRNPSYKIKQNLNKSKKRKGMLINPLVHMATLLALETLEKSYIIMKVLVLGISDHRYLAWQVGFLCLAMARPITIMKSVEIRLLFMESKLFYLMKKIKIEERMLPAIKDRAEKLISGEFHEKGDILLPFIVAHYLVEISTDSELNPFADKDLEELCFRAAVVSLTCKPKVFEIDYPILTEGLRKQRADLIVRLLDIYKSDPIKLNAVMNAVIDTDLAPWIGYPIELWWYLDDDTARTYIQEAMRNCRLPILTWYQKSTNNNLPRPYPTNAYIMQACGRIPSSNFKSPIDPLPFPQPPVKGTLLDFLQTMNNQIKPEGRPLLSDFISSAGPKERFRPGFKCRRTSPNQPTEALGYHLLEIAKHVAAKAGGSRFYPTRPNQVFDRSTPVHRLLQLCAIQLALYGLSVCNCVCNSWGSRNYQIHISWITALALDVGYVGLSYILEYWHGVFDPTEILIFAENCIQSIDTETIKFGGKFAFSCLMYASVLRSEQMQKALNFCKSYNDSLVESACHIVENVAKVSPVSEIFLYIPRLWLEMYNNVKAEYLVTHKVRGRSVSQMAEHVLKVYEDILVSVFAKAILPFVNLPSVTIPSNNNNLAGGNDKAASENESNSFLSNFLATHVLNSVSPSIGSNNDQQQQQASASGGLAFSPQANSVHSLPLSSSASSSSSPVVSSSVDNGTTIRPVHCYESNVGVAAFSALPQPIVAPNQTVSLPVLHELPCTSPFASITNIIHTAASASTTLQQLNQVQNLTHNHQITQLHHQIQPLLSPHPSVVKPRPVPPPFQTQQQRCLQQQQPALRRMHPSLPQIQHQRVQMHSQQQIHLQSHQQIRLQSQHQQIQLQSQHQQIQLQSHHHQIQLQTQQQILIQSQQQVQISLQQQMQFQQPLFSPAHQNIQPRAMQQQQQQVHLQSQPASLPSSQSSSQSPAPPSTLQLHSVSLYSQIQSSLPLKIKQQPLMSPAASAATLPVNISPTHTAAGPRTSVTQAQLLQSQLMPGVLSMFKLQPYFHELESKIVALVQKHLHAKHMKRYDDHFAPTKSIERPYGPFSSQVQELKHKQQYEQVLNTTLKYCFPYIQYQVRAQFYYMIQAYTTAIPSTLSSNFLQSGLPNMADGIPTCTALPLRLSETLGPTINDLNFTLEERGIYYLLSCYRTSLMSIARIAIRDNEMCQDNLAVCYCQYHFDNLKWIMESTAIKLGVPWVLHFADVVEHYVTNAFLLYYTIQMLCRYLTKKIHASFRSILQNQLSEIVKKCQHLFLQQIKTKFTRGVGDERDLSIMLELAREAWEWSPDGPERFETWLISFKEISEPEVVARLEKLLRLLPDKNVKPHYIRFPFLMP